MANPLINDRDRFAAANPETRVILNGRNWGVLDVGAGPVLLLIPGTLGRGDIFWHQIEALSDRMHIVAVSYPDSGGIKDWAADLAELFDQLHIDRASVLGSSLGGYLAQYFAGTYPAKIVKLFAANTLHSVKGLDQRPPYSMELETAPIDDLRAGFGNGLKAWAKVHPDQSDLVELLLQESDGRILEGELRARLNALKTGPELPQNQSEVITIETTDDPLIPLEIKNAVRERLNPSSAFRFLWGGHFPYVVRPELYTSLLEKSLGLQVTGPTWKDGSLSEQ
ncbi:MAG: alpha/beta hydrolase [Pseudomonas marincola]